MAKITIADEQREITEVEAIAAYLGGHGIVYEQWNSGRLDSPDATSEEILAEYAPEIDALKEAGGYVTADVINVHPETPGLDAMLEKFNKEHTHSEDEVRYIVKGRGTFHIRPKNEDGSFGTIFAIEMEAGDLINVPAGTHHWFDLCSERTIRAIRLFLDPSGWTPHYTGTDIHERYAPVCWGPAYIAAGGLRPAGEGVGIQLNSTN
ncbi:MAG: cupin domain-containing protein [Candidatus Hydrogenedens sp.]|nr:cupin domain-containing protein [Candidatus Hydrogenedens sp.]